VGEIRFGAIHREASGEVYLPSPGMGLPFGSVPARDARLPRGEFQDGAAVGADIGPFEDARLELPLQPDEVLPEDRLPTAFADRGAFGKGGLGHGGIVGGGAGGIKRKRKNPAGRS